MPPIELFPFRYRDPLSGKWKRARYVATREEIAARHTEWEIIGPPEIRGDEPVRMFGLGLDQSGAVTPASRHSIDQAPELAPSVDAAERFLLCLFLRRYVTWCARRRRFAAMQGAARLHREVCAQARCPLQVDER